jgi:hypothetical protein
VRSSLASSDAARTAPVPAAELAVMVSCHGVVCALPARHVERLLLRDAVELLPPTRQRARNGRPLPQVVHAQDEPYAVWNLGTLLGMAPLSVAWVLLQVPAEPHPVSIALRTGPCLIVQPMPETAPLPPGLFRERGPGISGAFSTAQLRGKPLAAALGLTLDPAALWSRDELAASRAAVAAARVGQTEGQGV